MDSGFPFDFGENDEAEQTARADLALRLAVDMTLAGIARINVQGTPDGQVEQLQAAAGSIFPEALSLVREALEDPE